MHTDHAEYQFLTVPSAAVDVWVVASATDKPEIQIHGNRAGLLSLANVLLWLHANDWRREFLSLAELPFIRVKGSLAVQLRVSDNGSAKSHGRVSRADRGDQFEWILGEDELRQTALMIHRLACKPEHEYDRLALADGSAAEIEVRMTDALDWMRSET